MQLKTDFAQIGHIFVVLSRQLQSTCRWVTYPWQDILPFYPIAGLEKTIKYCGWLAGLPIERSGVQILTKVERVRVKKRVLLHLHL